MNKKPTQTLNELSVGIKIILTFYVRVLFVQGGREKRVRVVFIVIIFTLHKWTIIEPRLQSLGIELGAHNWKHISSMD